MTWLQKLLLITIGIELAVAAWFVARRVPPLPDAQLSALEELTAKEIREFEDSAARRSADDWLKLAEIYLAFGRLPEAEYCYAQVDQRKPTNPDYLYFWGTCLSRYGATDRAREKYEQAIAAGSRLTPFCWFRLGLDWLRDEKPQAAEAALLRAAAVPEARLYLARLLIRARRYDEARQQLQELLSQYPDSLRTTQMLGWLEQAAGNIELAETYFDHLDHLPERIARGDPSAAVDEMRVGQFGSRRLQLASGQREQLGQIADAIEASRQALSIHYRKNYVLQLAHLHMRARQPDEAIRLLNECRQRFGDSAELLEQLGDAYRMHGDLEQARQIWEQGAQIPEGRPTPINYRLHAKLLESYRAAGDMEAAQRHEGLGHYHAARLAYEQNQLPLARQHLQRSTELLPDHGNSWFYLAETCRHLGDQQAARTAYQKCLELLPDHGRAHRGLARLENVSPSAGAD